MQTIQSAQKKGKAVNEKAKTEKTEVERGTSSVQREAQSGDAQIVKECEQKEARLFAERGHGGYIVSEDLEELRRKKAEAAKRLKTGG